jgi:AAA15 family ATPase/GTPase
MIKAEYLRFLQTLRTDDISEDVRRIANIVLQYFEELMPLTTYQGNRIKKIVELSQSNWELVSSQIESTQEHMTNQTHQYVQLKKFKIGPFRGFAQEEIFDLDSKVILIYGPNGTGKSSFCEALEFSLLGSVAEADNKRFRDQGDYFKNAYTNNYVSPILIAVDSEGNEALISSNEALYRFCFIEKNRIDNFSRIAAQVPTKQTELISSLFGLDAFFEFVRNFTDKMDQRYIDLVGIKAKELSEKENGISGHKQQLEKMIPEELKKIGNDERDLVNDYRMDCTYTQMVEEINGTEEKAGRIVQLNDELQKPIDNKSNRTFIELKKLQETITLAVEEYDLKQEELVTASRDVSFKQLYEAVLQVQEKSSNCCPACNTPISDVTVNPYLNARKELTNLQYLGELQERTRKLIENIKNDLRKLSDIISSCCTYFPEKNTLSAFQVTDDLKPTLEWWKLLNQQLDDGSTPLQRAEYQVKQLEDFDKHIDEVIQMRNDKKGELKRLRGFSESIIKIETRKETARMSKEFAVDRIKAFGLENAQLKKEAEAEKSAVILNKRIADAYSLYVQKLNEYLTSLPALMLEDLGEIVVELYNAFNRNDADYEQITKIRLPLQQNQRLEISYQTRPDVYFDALHILSEGHIRCIGLAILTAKNIKERCPFLIFDDPVNAIDDDHRESIRKTLFEDDYLTGKQIILTCHGEEFFKDIQNLISCDRMRQSKAFTFLPKISELHISVDHHCSPRNYIIAARMHFNKNETREALDKSRKALESLTHNKVWKYVNKHSDGNLSIIMRAFNAPIELRNLTEQLKKKIGKRDFGDQEKDKILNPLGILLGIDGSSREWRYLNKGTHEEMDRAEFDRHTVKKIVEALEQIEASLN